LQTTFLRAKRPSGVTQPPGTRTERIAYPENGKKGYFSPTEKPEGKDDRARSQKTGRGKSPRNLGRDHSFERRLKKKINLADNAQNKKSWGKARMRQKRIEQGQIYARPSIGNGTREKAVSIFDDGPRGEGGRKKKERQKR